MNNQLLRTYLRTYPPYFHPSYGCNPLPCNDSFFFGLRTYSDLFVPIVLKLPTGKTVAGNATTALQPWRYLPSGPTGHIYCRWPRARSYCQVFLGQDESTHGRMARGVTAISLTHFWGGRCNGVVNQTLFNWIKAERQSSRALTRKS